MQSDQGLLRLHANPLPDFESTTNVDIDNKECAITLTDSGFIHLFAYVKGYDFLRKCPSWNPYCQC